jgi:nitrate reductase NapD
VEIKIKGENMNISSIVIQCKSEDFDRVKQWCEESDICDYHFGEAKIGKIIVTIEGAGVEEEIEKLKKLQVVPGVITADMMMSYQEELDEEIKKLEAADEVPAMLNDDTLDVKDIVYNGDLKKKF